ncbi:hypothetical protein PHJA_000053700 [Phtheirospermum japonicum]|uniref:Glycosyltransferase 61 catalytic domain-containing protein n=1 Tax=Phtheirospermum japonicum TaxID=374723 RepID=A0A830B138_9LAMI|nr:hypothetical protein PHJA_000053700 [Phtheirospermum japonicum]
MEKEPRNPVFRVTLTPWIFLLVLPLLYLDVQWRNNIQLEQRLHYISSPETITSGTRKININENVKHKRGFILTRLVKGEEDRAKLKANGFVCNTEVFSKHCVTNQPVQIDTATMTVTVASDQPVHETVIRPYARQEDDTLLKTVTPVRILHGNTTPPACHHRHEIPAVVFSTSGFVGNVFHEINEIVIPLYVTTRHFKSRVLLVMEDYRPSFLTKYGKILSRLTSYKIMNPAENSTVHCFPGAVIGLKFHGHLAVNSTDIPTGLSMRDLRQLLRESLGLKYSHVSMIKRLTVMLLSRRTTRRFLNEDEMVAVMEEIGFRVVVVARARVISNLGLFASMINSCSVLVGAHGAGLTNEVFLADGGVMVQVDLIGLEWAAAAYYGDPARAMGVHYLRYRVEPEESSLLKVFYGQRNHTFITDPRALPVQAGREVYLNGQNVRINVARFRETMVEAMSLVRDSEV